MNAADGGNAMTPEELKAYEWALNQNFQSVAARYARTLAKFIQNSNITPRATVATALAELLSTVTGLPVSDYSTDGDGAELVRQDSVIAAVKTAIAALGLAEKEQQ